jgi:iron complex outermembrane receptor protein
VSLNAATAAEPAPDPNMIVLDEVVVTATQRAEPAQSIPVSITALSAEDLTAAGVAQMRDLVGLTPNLTQQGSYGRTRPAFFIRGIGNTQFNPNGTSKIGVYLDDTYLNSTAVQGAQLFDIQRVEIARGPQGYLFGQNTTGGLIRAITRKPQIGAGFNADSELTLGRFDQLDGQVNVGFDTGATSAARISVFDQNRDGVGQNLLLNQSDGDTNVLAGRAQWLWSPAADIEVLANAHGSRDRSGLRPYKQLSLLDPVTGARCANPFLGSRCVDPSGYSDTADLRSGRWNVPNQHAFVDALGGSVTVNWMMPVATFTSVTAYERNTARIGEDTDAGPADLVRGNYFGNPRQVTQEFRLTSPQQRLRWLAGLFYFHEDLDTSVAYPAPGLGPGAFTGSSGVLEAIGQQSTLMTQSYAGFGTVDFAATERLKLSLGFRFNREKKDLQYAAFIDDLTRFRNPASYLAEDDIRRNALVQTIDYTATRSSSDISGRASLAYTLTDGVLAYASFARGFNGSNYNGGAFLNQAEAALVAPETLESYELGLKTDLTSQLRVNLSGFYYDFTNQQVYVAASSGSNVFQQLSNAAASSLYGGEMELAWRPVRELIVQVGAGYTYSRFDDFRNSVTGDLTGKRLPSAPRTNINGLLRYEVSTAHGLVSFEVDDKYQSGQFFSVNNDPLLGQRAYSIANVRVSLTTRGESLTLTAFGLNVGNRSYLVGAYDLSTYGFDEYVPGDPRTVGVSVLYRVR